MNQLKTLLKNSLKPVIFEKWYYNLLVTIPRVLGGLMLCFEFGSSKFGMPWSTTDEMGLFQVASWFPEDVAKFGIPFALAPTLFAWLGAASEAIGGLFLAIGLGTRIWSILISFTMLTAIFLQKWPDAMEYGSSWPLLPALGFLWIGIYSIVLGSGKFGFDYLISKKNDK